MTAVECDGAIRNIEKEILRECANKAIQVHANFTNYYIKLLALDPKWGISTSVMTNRIDVQNFIKFVVSKLADQNTAPMITLKMQFYFTCNFHHQNRMIRRNRAELMARLGPLQGEILDIKKISPDETAAVVYKKIIYYITLASGLGNPTIEAVFQEVSAALSSILNEKELRDYLAQPKYVKEEQLHEFTKLVTGIRLFNKDCSKGGEGMEDLPSLLTEAIEATNAELQKTLVWVMDKVNLMTTAIDLVYSTMIDERGRYCMELNLPHSVTSEEVDYVKDYLLTYRQYELYIRKLMDAVDDLEIHSNQIFNNLKVTLVELHQIVQHRIAIPVCQVFPHFIKLADIWYSLQDQTVLLAKFNQIMTNLQRYVKHLPFNETIPEMLLPEGQAPMTDAERLERTAGLHIPHEKNQDRVVDLFIIKNVDKIKLEYLGFCGWKLVQTDGGLLPANPTLGVLNAMNMNFVFSSVEAGKAFCRNPEKFVMEVINLARRKPEYINFLNIQDQLDIVQDIKQLVKEPPLLPLTNEIEIQTETHFVPKNIDRTYMWNVWDLKRRALQLANLTKCQTVACQTMKTDYRQSVKTQTYGITEKDVQTKKDNYSNVPKPSNFIFGLRGRKDDKQLIVDLTRPVDE